MTEYCRICRHKDLKCSCVNPDIGPDPYVVLDNIKATIQERLKYLHTCMEFSKDSKPFLNKQELDRFEQDEINIKEEIQFLDNVFMKFS